MRILVTGSRNWPYSLKDVSGMVMFGNAMRSVLRGAGLWDEEYGMPTGNSRIIVGDCPSGLDLIAREWCLNNWMSFQVYAADWNRYGKKAGPLRNQQMINQKPDVCVGFPKPGESNRGTLGCMELARRADIQVLDGCQLALEAE